jgi:uncharacterized protein (DUF2252 family)
MKTTATPGRLSVTLPSAEAKRARVVAKSQRMSANRVLVQQVESGSGADQNRE